MSELYNQSIEKLTAAQIRGFESIEALKRQYKLRKSKAQNQIVELLNANSDEDSDLDITETHKEQLARRRQDQQEVK